jgi:hypothetical protein
MDGMSALAVAANFHQRAVLTGRDSDGECRGFSGFFLQPTKWRAIIQAVRINPARRSLHERTQTD